MRAARARLARDVRSTLAKAARPFGCPRSPTVPPSMIACASMASVPTSGCCWAPGPCRGTCVAIPAVLSFLASLCCAQDPRGPLVQAGLRDATCTHRRASFAPPMLLAGRAQPLKLGKPIVMHLLDRAEEGLHSG